MYKFQKKEDSWFVMFQNAEIISLILFETFISLWTHLRKIQFWNEPAFASQNRLDPKSVEWERERNSVRNHRKKPYWPVKR